MGVATRRKPVRCGRTLRWAAGRAGPSAQPERSMSTPIPSADSVLGAIFAEQDEAEARERLWQDQTGRLAGAAAEVHQAFGDLLKSRLDRPAALTKGFGAVGATLRKLASLDVEPPIRERLEFAAGAEGVTAPFRLVVTLLVHAIDDSPLAIRRLVSAACRDRPAALAEGFKWLGCIRDHVAPPLWLPGAGKLVDCDVGPAWREREAILNAFKGRRGQAAKADDPRERTATGAGECEAPVRVVGVGGRRVAHIALSSGQWSEAIDITRPQAKALEVLLAAWGKNPAIPMSGSELDGECGAASSNKRLLELEKSDCRFRMVIARGTKPGDRTGYKLRWPD